jgi:dihydrodipicolinate synthase/N-acetylneuraminate lyase
MKSTLTFVGPWAGLPVAWDNKDQFDEQTYRGDVARCCEAGMPGVYTGGTTGEFYAMEFDEFQAITRATVEECRARKTPCAIGCSSTYTLGVCRRAAFAAEAGADAIQVALPFWMEVADHEIVPFFREVARAADGLALSVYETTRAKRVLTLDQHRAIKDATPNYRMVKANAQTLGNSVEGCRDLAKMVSVFVGEDRWAELGPVGAKGGCSSLVYWGPRFILRVWEDVEKDDWPAVEAGCKKMQHLFHFLDEMIAGRNLLDSAVDRLGGIASGFLKTSLRCRGPYSSASRADVDKLRRWYQEHLPEMLDHEKRKH